MVVSPSAEVSEAGRSQAVVRASGIRYTYGSGVPALDGIDLEIGVGEIVGLVGPKGAGKTTLLRVLAGDLDPQEGALELPPRRSAAKRVMLGYASNDGTHFEALSGRENALFFARAAGLRRKEAAAAVEELMGVLGLERQAPHPVSQYATADKRKLLLLEALVHRPALTVLDEPFVGLDQGAREALVHQLRLRSAQRGSVVIASDNLRLLPEVADRLVLLHEGRVVASGRVAELLASAGRATRLEIELERRPHPQDLRFQAGITVVSDGDLLVLDTERGPATVGEVSRAVVAAGGLIKSMTVREVDLAEAFRRLAGVELGE